MSSHFPERPPRDTRLRLTMIPGVILVILAVSTVGGAAIPGVRTAHTIPALRVCADPNNLPFSDSTGAGLENQLARLVARDLGMRVEYSWWAQRRGFIRNTLNAGTCDVVLGVPQSMDLLLTTRPYYRSTYVFVTRRDARFHPTSFDDDALRTRKIGVQVIGDDFANTPPVHALSRRGLSRNLVGFSIYGDYAKAHPTTAIMDAVVRGEVDVAVVWGPLAGWYAKTSRTPLLLTPVSPQMDLPYLPFVFDISMGVRHRDSTLRARLDSVIVRQQPAIDVLLRSFGVPRVQAARRTTT